MSNRTELDQLQARGYKFDHTWQVVDLFEKKIADFFGAPYAIATDCCTHALELSIRLLDQPTTSVQVPLKKRAYFLCSHEIQNR